MVRVFAPGAILIGKRCDGDPNFDIGGTFIVVSASYVRCYV